MQTSDIVSKLIEAGISDADEALVNQCIAKGWVLDNDTQILELAMSLQDEAPKPNKKVKGGGLTKAGENKPAPTQAENIAAAEDIPNAGGTPPQSMGQALSHAAMQTDQVITVMETELRAGAKRYVRQKVNSLAAIVEDVPDEIEQGFIDRVGGMQSRVGSFRSRFQGHAASLFN